MNAALARRVAVAAWRRLRWPAALLCGYLALAQLFVWLAADDGLFFPAVAGKGLLALVLGLVVLALRLFVLLVLPALVVYRLVLAVWDALQARPPDRAP